jgi:hypothetical protein
MDYEQRIKDLEYEVRLERAKFANRLRSMAGAVDALMAPGADHDRSFDAIREILVDTAARMMQQLTEKRQQLTEKQMKTEEMVQDLIRAIRQSKEP